MKPDSPLNRLQEDTQYMAMRQQPVHQKQRLALPPLFSPFSLVILSCSLSHFVPALRLSNAISRKNSFYFFPSNKDHMVKMKFCLLYNLPRHASFLLLPTLCRLLYFTFCLLPLASRVLFWFAARNSHKCCQNT